MIIDWAFVIYALTYTGAVLSGVAGLLAFLKKIGVISDKKQIDLPEEMESTFERIADSPLVGISGGFLAFIRNWIVKTNPDMLIIAAKKVMEFAINDVKTDDKVFQFVVEHDEELLALVVGFYSTIRDVALQEDKEI